MKKILMTLIFSLILSAYPVTTLAWGEHRFFNDSAIDARCSDNEIPQSTMLGWICNKIPEKVAVEQTHSKKDSHPLKTETIVKNHKHKCECE